MNESFSSFELVRFVVARFSEGNTCFTQTAQRKEKPPEESPRNKEGQSWCWQKGATLVMHCVQKKS